MASKSNTINTTVGVQTISKTFTFLYSTVFVVYIMVKSSLVSKLSAASSTLSIASSFSSSHSKHDSSNTHNGTSGSSSTAISGDNYLKCMFFVTIKYIQECLYIVISILKTIDICWYKRLCTYGQLYIKCYI